MLMCTKAGGAPSSISTRLFTWSMTRLYTKKIKYRRDGFDIKATNGLTGWRVAKAPLVVDEGGGAPRSMRVSVSAVEESLV